MFKTLEGLQERSRTTASRSSTSRLFSGNTSVSVCGQFRILKQSFPSSLPWPLCHTLEKPNSAEENLNQSPGCSCRRGQVLGRCVHRLVCLLCSASNTNQTATAAAVQETDDSEEAPDCLEVRPLYHATMMLCTLLIRGFSQREKGRSLFPGPPKQPTKHFIQREHPCFWTAGGNPIKAEELQNRVIIYWSIYWIKQ